MTNLDDILRRVAAEQLPSILEEATITARRQAVEVLTARLTDLLLDGAGPVERPPSPSSPVASSPRPAARPASIVPTGGWYLYGLTMPQVAQSVTGRAGVGSAAIQAVPIGRIAAVVSPLDRDRSCDAGADADLDVLTPRIAEHQRVLEDILDLGPVVPMRFGIMYPELSALVSAIEPNAGHLNAELRRLEGVVEWGLSIEWAGHRPALTADERSQTGRQYLSGRRQDRSEAERAAQDAADAADAVHRALLTIAADAVVHRIGRPNRDAKPVILRASYLVDRSAADSLRQAAGRALESAPSPLALTGELTGPWPAYHFVSLPLAPVG